MPRIRIAFAALVLLTASASVAAADLPTNAPDPAPIRANIDALLKRFTDTKTKATLGMVQQAMDLSISYGAPAWNDGDHEACCDFYLKTAQTICDAFPDESSATPGAAAAITDLKSALAKTKKSTDIDLNAWTIRYAFDKAAVILATDVAKASAMMQLGTECLNRGQCVDAEDAFSIAANVAHELQGLSPTQQTAACFLAPMALTDALFGNRKFTAAAANLQSALIILPDLPALTRDMHGVFGNPALFTAALAELSAQADKSPNDPNLQLLLGYEYYFSGRRTSAKRQFEKTLELDKDNPAAKAFLDHIVTAQPPHTPQPGDPTRSSL